MKSEVFIVKAEGTEDPDSLSRKARQAYLATGINEKIIEGDFVALKIHFGEKNNKGHIRPQWLPGIIGEIEKKTKRAFLTDSNTLYMGERSNSVDHIRLAWKHGFRPETIGLPVIIADGLIGRDTGSECAAGVGDPASRIASAIRNSDVLLGLAHLTGHVQSGLGGSIKNLGMGCASRSGKLDQHSVVHPKIKAKQCRNCGLCLDYCPEKAILPSDGHVRIDDAACIGCGECLVVCKHGAIKIGWDEDSRRIQEKIAEYAATVGLRFKGKCAFLNFLIKITKNCDCMAKDEPRIVEDIGILASSDPVAIDTASADLVLDRGGDVFRKGYDIDWSVQLLEAERRGLGSRAYVLRRLSG